MVKSKKDCSIVEELIEVPATSNPQRLKALEKTAVTAAFQKKSTNVPFKCKQCD